MSKEIFVTSYFRTGDSAICSPEVPFNTCVGRPNEWDYIHGDAQNKMESFDGSDIPCFFNLLS